MRPDRPSTSFPAMGGTVTVAVSGDRGLLDHARRRIDDLEAKWSRFRPSSEVARLNGDRHRPIRVSDDTLLLVERSRAAWTLTSGAFDPTVHDALVRWGYDRDLADVHGLSSPPVCERASSPASIVVDRAARTIQLGGASGFDPGGIGKGLAADVVAVELIDRGAEGAVVDVGGDLRIVGPGGVGWTVSVEDPLAPDRELLRLSSTGGGIATSSDRRRRWRAGHRDAHHLIDPVTGSPAHRALAGVTVLAGETWWAEALTKAVLVGGLPVEELTARSASGITRARSGEVRGTPDLLGLLEEAA